MVGAVVPAMQGVVDGKLGELGKHGERGEIRNGAQYGNEWVRRGQHTRFRRGGRDGPVFLSFPPPTHRVTVLSTNLADFR
jgi:hypothetical protein